MSAPASLRQVELRLLEALGLKELPRTGWLRADVREPESVAAHSWGVAWLVLALSPPEIDRGRALAMAVLHDLAEVRTGDITPHDGVSAEDKSHREQTAFEALTAPFGRGDEMRELWREYETAVTREARFVRACDKLDMALQARRYASEQDVDTVEFVESALAVLEEPELRALAGEGTPTTS
jgi:putative hydrolases of HD superfamily